MIGQRGSDPADERLFLLSVASAATAFLAWLSMHALGKSRSDAILVAVVVVQALGCLAALVSSWIYLKHPSAASGWRRNVALVVFAGSSLWLLFLLLVVGALQLIGDD